MIRRVLLVIAWALVAPAHAQLAPISDHHADAALFLAATAQQVQPPQAVHNMAEYDAVYGRLAGVDHGALAAARYFVNGGQTLYVIDPGGFGGADIQQALALSRGLPVSIVALPGAACCISDPAVLRARMQVLVEHVESSPNRFAVLSAPRNSDAAALLSYRAMLNGKYAALYAPWLMVDDGSASGGRRAVPPAAAVAGVIARIDRTKGIFKTPAGPDAALSAALNPLPERDLSAAQGDFNVHGINVLRTIPNIGDSVIWGARVLDTGYAPYITRYRYPRHLRHSILASLHGPFDANPATVASIEALIDAYLHERWLAGAMKGTTSSQAYFSACSLSEPTIACHVGVSMLKPAEFDVFQVQWPTGEVIFQSGFE